ncbi:lysine-specific histone demethylase 1B-like [Xenia sp. Carnegie-2017]|uniref:lysine-specific histone demethylase 1B-like n=1 Tax=Xenia sp. Carnegie-2017 TaxID=2897299 RepID=UPI001F038592|nr:lysine-specific histone demethylase 1B-like [Xenia sp. Carnegie-2017]
MSSRRTIKTKRKQILQSGEEKPRFRKCVKTGCPADKPECFANGVESCCGKGYTSRWYHLSDGEHFCNECFDHYYRSHKDGFQAYDQWKKHWNGTSQQQGNLKMFMAERILPYWVKCCDCGKWRQYPITEGDLTTDVVESWTLECTGIQKIYYRKAMKTILKATYATVKKMSDACHCTTGHWFAGLSYRPLLKFSPTAVAFFVFLDGLGLSPTDNNWDDKSVKEKLAQAEIRPFSQSEMDGCYAFCFQPDVMEENELQYFSEFARTPGIYLAMRNLILTLWCLNYKQILTLDKCVSHLIIRGLVRISLIQHMERILNYLTVKGFINYGILESTSQIQFPITSKPFSSYHVIVIGAGTSGLGAAKQLHNFGVKVTILEAQGRIGGRVQDENIGNVIVGKGAQIMNGCINNPMAIIAKQCGHVMKCLGDKCDLIEENGDAINEEFDSKGDFHFNALLDAVADWRKQNECDCSLDEKLSEIHKEFLDQTATDFPPESERLLNFHFGNLEYACAAPLDKVSALCWDQNETFPQFQGNHTILTHGYESILQRLAKGLDIHMNTEVISIDYSTEAISVRTKDGRIFIADKVIVTVPLSLLKSETIAFTPKLPEEKIKSIKRLGAGLVEKVILSFPRCFWWKLCEKTESFGHIPSSKENRGFCGIFYDLSSKTTYGKKKKGNIYVLMTVLAGNSAVEAQEMEDKEIVERCLKILRSMFPDETVPQPYESIVTHWGKEKFSKMAYSYIATGASGEDYTKMSEDVEKRLYFAGEATNRDFPQTVTGAYLSGLREAYKVHNDLINEVRK